ncbi:IS5 family transposase [Verrucomicrobia bacterium LW23]|nr:IS5 family transposase [Verrucomicrobia bacterium LW23]
MHRTNSTKIHVLCDALGNPLRIRLTTGNSSDYPQALPLIQGLDIHTVIADRGYDGDAVLRAIPTPFIPPQKNRKIQRSYDEHLYKEHHLIERIFLHLKNFRRVATRYDKLASFFLSFIHIAASMLWLK